MPCDPSYIIYPAVRTFALAPNSSLQIANGTAGPSACLRLVTATPAFPHPRVVTGPCAGDASDVWNLAPNGHLVSGLNASLCAALETPPQPYHASAGFVVPVPCGGANVTAWAFNSTTRTLHYNDSACLAAVPPNYNASIALVPAAASASAAALAFSVADPAGALALQVPGDRLAAGGLRLAVGAATTRDAAPTASDDAAHARLAQQQAAAAVSSFDAFAAAHAARWAAFWAAGAAVQLDPRRALLEGYWYGMQYFLGSTARPGKVAPGLWGVWGVTDAPAWNGDYTIDYNFQANYYGAISSNRPELVRPMLDTLSADWFLLPSAMRAAARAWVAGAAGNIGQTVQDMTCGPMVQAYEDPSVCPDGFGGYQGFEMTTHLGPYPGLFYYSDLSVRFVGGLVAAPFIEYADSVPDLAYLNSTAYPVVAGVADFYASYVQADANGTLHVPFACAQEICGPSGVKEFDPVADLALGRMALRAAARYAGVLGRDAQRAAKWNATLARLADYPTTVAGDGSGRTVFAEARPITPGEAIPWSGNARYPIVYFAPMHPAGELGLTAPAPLLQVARDTVAAIDAVNGYRPTNGLCLAWPSATRVSNTTMAGALLDSFEQALAATLQTNWYPDLAGGGVEQAGGTLAVNELMLQSHEGFLRLFPAFPKGEAGSFTQLRARWGLLVDAAVSAAGEVSGVQFTATVTPGEPVRVLWPGPTAPRATCKGGAAQPVACGTAGGEGGGTVYCLPMAAGDVCRLA